MFFAQFNLHLPVELYQLLFVRLHLGQKVTQTLMQVHFTGDFSVNTMLKMYTPLLLDTMASSTERKQPMVIEHLL